MSLWDTAGGKGLEQFARSESWAIHEFVNRTKKRAVFVTGQGVLFAKGQEQRLREYLVHRGGECNEVEAVISLPPGVFGAAAIAGAVLIVNPGGHTDDVYMADLGSGRRSLQEAGDIVTAGRGIALGKVPTDKARSVTRDEIAAMNTAWHRPDTYAVSQTSEPMQWPWAKSAPHYVPRQPPRTRVRSRWLKSVSRT